MMTSKTRDRPPRLPPAKPMETIATYDRPPPPPPPGSGGIWIEGSTLPASLNASYPVLVGGRSDKPSRARGVAASTDSTDKRGGPRIKPRGKAEGVYATDYTPKPPPDPFGGRVSKALRQGGSVHPSTFNSCPGIGLFTTVSSS
jgi:hypothetical protein